MASAPVVDPLDLIADSEFSGSGASTAFSVAQIRPQRYIRLIGQALPKSRLSQTTVSVRNARCFMEYCLIRQDL
jgi:hypothetical protein